MCAARAIKAPPHQTPLHLHCKTADTSCPRVHQHCLASQWGCMLQRLRVVSKQVSGVSSLLLCVSCRLLAARRVEVQRCRGVGEDTHTADAYTSC